MKLLRHKRENWAPMLNPIVVALDVDGMEQALSLADQLSEIVGGFKLGPRLILKYGEKIVQEVAQRGPVFIDNKHFDIPSTMIAAVKVSFEMGASLVTVHALSGNESLEALARLEVELNQIRPFRILAVTVLTSWEEKKLPPNMKEQKISDHVLSMVQSVREAGLRGVVCSSQELSTFSDELKRDLYICTPGIRFDLQDRQDQKRVMSPQLAIQQGARILVVGRPIIEAANPREMAADFVMSAYE